MPISDDSSELLDQILEAPSGILQNNLWMEEYLSQSHSRLEAIAQRVQRGEQIDGDSREWMLNQVDFMVESLGADTVEFDDSLRSRLLQLVLAIANLNHCSRSQIRPVSKES